MNKIGKPGGIMGRPIGAKNKLPVILKDMILEALSDSGGVGYLVRQAEENPGPFLQLVGKILPMQVTGADGKALTIKVFTCVPTPEMIEEADAENADEVPMLGTVTIPEDAHENLH